MTKKPAYLLKTVISFSLAFLFTLLLVKPSVAGNLSGSQFEDDPYRVETFTVDDPGTLNVETSGGYIAVEGSTENTVRVEMFVQKDGEELSPNDTDLDNWDIEISQSGNVVNVIAERTSGNWILWGNNNDISVSFTVYTPDQMKTNLNTSGGHISIANLNGEQELSTSGGHLEIENIEGDVNARTSGGHIMAHDVNGKLEVRTSGGSIEIENIRGDTNARTSGGHITAHHINGNLAIRTSGGHINLLNINGAIEASTSGGGIEADLETIGQFVNLKTSGGNIDITVPGNIGLNLDLSGSYINANLSNFSGEIEHDDVEGQLNGGGPSISARTSGGTVSLSFQ